MSLFKPVFELGEGVAWEDYLNFFPLLKCSPDIGIQMPLGITRVPIGEFKNKTKKTLGLEDHFVAICLRKKRKSYAVSVSLFKSRGEAILFNQSKSDLVSEKCQCGKKQTILFTGSGTTFRSCECEKK